MTAKILFHPTLLARRAAEIAQRQGGRIRRDACGRPFVVAGADPFAEAPAPAPVDPGRFEWLLHLMEAYRAGRLREAIRESYRRAGLPVP